MIKIRGRKDDRLARESVSINVITKDAHFAVCMSRPEWGRG
jgi:hypothetical protein